MPYEMDPHRRRKRENKWKGTPLEKKPPWKKKFVEPETPIEKVNRLFEEEEHVLPTPEELEREHVESGKSYEKILMEHLKSPITERMKKIKDLVKKFSKGEIVKRED